MYCSECGAKNEKGSRFCLECGAPLEQENTKVEERQSTQKEKKSKQPMSKKNKMLCIFIMIIVVVLGVGYKVGTDLTGPKKIVEEYVQASIQLDGEKLYSYLELEGDQTFVSKKIFTELIKNGDTAASNIENYKITDVEYGEGKLTAKVKVTYTVKDSSNEQETYITLTKQKDKKYFVFDNWKITDLTASRTTVSDYTIKVTKGATVTFSNVVLEAKYLNTEQSTSKLDVYVLPQVFTKETTLKTVLPSGMEIEEKVTPSSYSIVHTVSFNQESLTDASKEILTTAMKDHLTNLYNQAINRVAFQDMKANYEKEGLDLTNLEQHYNAFVSSLAGYSTTLKQITFNEVALEDLELTENGYLKVEVDADYNYLVEYTTWNSEIQTHNGTDSDSMTLILGYQDGGYYLVDIDDLTTYFSRY